MRSIRLAAAALCLAVCVRAQLPLPGGGGGGSAAVPSAFSLSVAAGTLSVANASAIALQTGDAVNTISAATRTAGGTGSGTCTGYLYETGGTIYLGTAASCSVPTLSGITAAASITAFPSQSNPIGEMVISAGVIQSIVDRQARQRSPKTPVAGSLVSIAESPTSNTFSVLPSGGVNSQTGTTYTVLNSDCGKLVTFSNASAIAVTLPQAGASSEFQNGCVIRFRNLGAGTVTITPTTSTFVGSSSPLPIYGGQGVDVYSNGANYYTQPGQPDRALRSTSFINVGSQVCQASNTALTGGVIPITVPASGAWAVGDRILIEAWVGKSTSAGAYTVTLRQTQTSAGTALASAVSGTAASVSGSTGNTGYLVGNLIITATGVTGAVRFDAEGRWTGNVDLTGQLQVDTTTTFNFNLTVGGCNGTSETVEALIMVTITRASV